MSPVSSPPVLRPTTVAGVPVGTLFTAGAVPGAAAGRRVTGVTLDSRLVRPGDLYVALPGRTHHGAEFAGAAVRAGAVAVLTDPAGARLAAAADGVPVVAVPDPRVAMAGLAAQVYGEPGAALTLYGVTGTNGKTTTCALLEAALLAAGRTPGMVGTLGYRVAGRPLPGARTTITTPESPELQALLAVLRERGADSVAMEVSSHALALGRVDALRFDVAGFTNLGRDHLDFHGDEESYFAAKAALFTPERTRHAVLNVDDPRGRELADRVRRTGAVGLTTVGLTEPAEVTVLTSEPTPDGRTAVRARLGRETLDLTLGLPGEYNLRNALTALAMLAVTGVDLPAAAAGLATAVVPGRVQRVDLGPDAPLVVVDFAHTPQAVAAVLAALAGAGGRPRPPGRRRIVVLGCGGDRDQAKRGPMGRAAAEGAEVVLVTDDNPRTEDPAAIRRAVLAGARDALRDGARAELLEVGDRRAAVAEALRRAAPGDVVAVLGKGHEQGQEVAGQVHPFADADVVVQEWARLRGDRGSA